MKKKQEKPYNTTSLLSFQKRFPDEDTCWQYLVQMRWYQGFACPSCNSGALDFLESRKLYECRACGKQTSATARTVFHKSRVPLQKWFWAIFLMATSKKGVSMLYLQRQLEIKSYQTVWLLGHKIRQAMLQRDALYGPLPGDVQADETFIGGKRTRAEIQAGGSNKTPFLVVVGETSKGKPTFAKVEKLTSDSVGEVSPAIEKAVSKGSTVKSDGGSCFKHLPDKGYKLQPMSYFDFPKETTQHLRWANTFISNAKRFLLSTYHGVPAKYRKAYLGEFAYRYNRRYWPKQAFDRLLFACLCADPAPLKNLPELNR